MNKSDFKNLSTGDIVRGKYSAKSFVVMENLGNGTIIVARTETMTNPEEWDLVYKAHLERLENDSKELLDSYEAYINI